MARLENCTSLDTADTSRPHFEARSNALGLTPLIVFVSHGIRFLTNDTFENTPFKSDVKLEEQRDNLHGRLSALNTVQGVKLELCDITRSQVGLPEDKLYKDVKLVPSGVARLAELQHQGFAYLKIE